MPPVDDEGEIVMLSVDLEVHSELGRSGLHSGELAFDQCYWRAMHGRKDSLAQGPL